MGIIKSILENDLYKFSMGHYYQTMYPEAVGTFTFKDRNNLVFNDMFLVHLNCEFMNLNELVLTDEECEWAITNIPYIPRHYWEWLKTFRFDSRKIHAWLDEDKHLRIEVTDAIYKVTMYEIPILAIVSEMYYKYHAINLSNFEYQVSDPVRKKIELARENDFRFSEFGMRRRYSHEVEDKVCKILSQEGSNCAGTSTVYFAKKYGLKPIGTMAHELFMATAALTSPKEANYIVMENWSKVYDGNLGTVLTDTYTVDAFLRAFSMKLAKLYDGVRHDSGDPIEFGEKIIQKYESYNIDPRSKTIIFSDALTFEKCAELKKHFDGRIKVSFGIGTNLTNDLYDVDMGFRIKPMNIVMKLKDFQVNPRQPKYGCVKLSDVPSKAIGKPEDIANYKYQIGIE
jgi:nicotinate phosphoribosyltransferase